MKSKFLGLLCVAALVAVSFNAKADLVVYNTYILDSALGPPVPSERDFVAEELGIQDLVYLDKFETDPIDPIVPGGDVQKGWEGGGAIEGNEWFQVDIGIDATTGTVSWDLTGSGFELRAVLVKDGNFEGGQLYTLFEVTTDQYLSSNGPQDVFFGESLAEAIDRGISHVTFFGVRTESVPAPATLLLLGSGLLGLGLVRRRRGQAQTG